MPVKLVPQLRLLNPSLPITRFSLMKPISTVKPSRVFPILSRVFPHKLKYQTFSRKLGFPNLTTQTQTEFGAVRKFSTRRPGLEVKASKSLIEDEAELSDWVNELRSDSLRSTSTKLYSGSDGDGDFGSGRGRSSSVKRRRESDSDDYGSSSRGRGGFSSRGRGNRDSFDSYSRNSSGKGRFGGEMGGKDEGFMSRRRENGSRGGRRDSDSDDYGTPPSRGKEGLFNRGRGGVSSRGRGGLSNRGRGGVSSRGRGGRDSDDYGALSRGRGGRDSFELSLRGRSSAMGNRGGVSSGGRGGRDSDDYGALSKGRGGVSSRGRGSQNSDDYDALSRGRGGKDSFELSPRGRSSAMGNRGGRDSELGYGRDRGGGRGGRLRKGGSSFGREGLMISDSEDIGNDEDVDEDAGEGKLRDSFRELISEEDSEADDDDEEDSEADDDDEEDSEADDDDDENDGNELINSASSLSRLGIKDGPAVSLTKSQGGSDSYLSETRFDQCAVSSLSLKAIKDAGYEKMTVVQEATLPVILKGKDVLAKARTGTGKTVAFLLPSIEEVIKSPSVGRDQKRPPILVLVICPTRELASQAAAEANKLLKYHSSIGVQVVIGGTRLALEQKRMQANPCQILVATPGRLKDHIENTAGFATRLMGVKVLILDEADHLLDMGFRKDIEKIIAAVPKQRQTLLFSATVPQEVRQICHIALKRDHEYVNTVEEGSEETHSQVRQTYLVAPLDTHFPLLYDLLKDHITDDVDYKVLVFCTTAMVTKLVAELLGELNLNVREIHSRKPQSYRTRVSDEFRKSKGLILVTSDVSARGVDYPDVTLVIQVGLPADKEQYIHRLGRTGRKGKEGQGVLLLAPWEEFFLSTLRDLPISKAPLPSVDPDMKKKVEKALSHVEMKSKESAYQAWLGYYNSNKTVGKDKYRLVELANDFSRCMGLDNPPAIPKLVLGKMGLKNVPGLRAK